MADLHGTRRKHTCAYPRSLLFGTLHKAYPNGLSIYSTFNKIHNTVRYAILASAGEMQPFIQMIHSFISQAHIRSPWSHARIAHLYMQILKLIGTCL